MSVFSICVFSSVRRKAHRKEVLLFFTPSDRSPKPLFQTMDRSPTPLFQTMEKSHIKAFSQICFFFLFSCTQILCFNLEHIKNTETHALNNSVQLFGVYINSCVYCKIELNWLFKHKL